MGHSGTCLTPVPRSLPFSLQASQLGVYRAFVDNYGVAMEMAEKCCQANAQFAEISEVCTMLFRQVDLPLLQIPHDPAEQGTPNQGSVVSLSGFQMPLGWHCQPCAGTLL